MHGPAEPTAADLECVSEGMLTVREASSRSGLSRTRLFNLMKSGALPYASIGAGGTRIVSKRELDRYVASLLAATRNR